MTDWSKRAEGYDRLGWVRDSVSLCQIRDVLDTVLGPREIVDTRVAADLGAGTGAMTARLQQFGIWRGYMVDSSVEMLAQNTMNPEWVRVCCDAETWHPPEPVSVITARMLLHHMPEPWAALERWMSLLSPAPVRDHIIEGEHVPSAPKGGALMVFESVLPTDGKLDAANDLCKRALSLKEPGRHFFTPWDIARMMPSPHVEVFTWTTDRNSLLNWLESDPSMAPNVRTEIVRLHREAAEDPAVREAYAMEFDGDDILMRWRHCAVVGWKP